jgi:hypothetical protein
MPMSKLSTLNYLINSYNSGIAEAILYNYTDKDSEEVNLKSNYRDLEPSQNTIDAILNFASQYAVIQSDQTGNVELNLN